jgi:hypothetical protein
MSYKLRKHARVDVRDGELIAYHSFLAPRNCLVLDYGLGGARCLLQTKNMTDVEARSWIASLTLRSDLEFELVHVSKKRVRASVRHANLLNEDLAVFGLEFNPADDEGKNTLERALRIFSQQANTNINTDDLDPVRSAALAFAPVTEAEPIPVEDETAEAEPVEPTEAVPLDLTDLTESSDFEEITPPEQSSATMSAVQVDPEAVEAALSNTALKTMALLDSGRLPVKPPPAPVPPAAQALPKPMPRPLAPPKAVAAPVAHPAEPMMPRRISAFAPLAPTSPAESTRLLRAGLDTVRVEPVKAPTTVVQVRAEVARLSCVPRPEVKKQRVTGIFRGMLSRISGSDPEKPDYRNMRLGEILHTVKYCTQAQVEHWSRNARNADMKLGQFLIQQKIITRRELLRILSLQTGLPAVYLSEKDGVPANTHVTKKHCRELNVVPFNTVGSTLYIACTHRLKEIDVRRLQHACGRQIKLFLAADDELESFLKRSEQALSGKEQ